MLIAIIGDSNGVGQAATDHFDPAFNLTTPFTSVQVNEHYSGSLVNPIIWSDLATTTLRPYNASGSAAGAGWELTIGREMYAVGAAPWVAKFAISGTTTTDYLPTATFPVIGGNVYSQMLAYLDARVAESGQPLRAVVLSLGTNDASTSPLSAAFAANLATIITALRARYGASLVVILPLINVGATNPFVSTIRAAMVAYAASDSLSVLVNNDDLTLTDGFHYDANGYLTGGQRIAYAATDLLGFARTSVTGPQPAFVGSDAAVSGAGAQVPRSWSGQQDGDLEILVVPTGLAASTITLTSAQGFTPISAQATSLFSGLTQNLALFQRRVVAASLVNGRMPSPTVASTNSFNCAVIYCFRAPARYLATVDISAVQVAQNNAFGTVFSAAGPTTTKDNELIAMIAGCYSGGANSFTPVNAGLTAETKQRDGYYAIGSDYQLASLTTGVKVSKGLVSNTGLTYVSNAIMVTITLGIYSVPTFINWPYTNRLPEFRTSIQRAGFVEVVLAATPATAEWTALNLEVFGRPGRAPSRNRS